MKNKRKGDRVKVRKCAKNAEWKRLCVCVCVLDYWRASHGVEEPSAVSWNCAVCNVVGKVRHALKLKARERPKASGCLSLCSPHSLYLSSFFSLFAGTQLVPLAGSVRPEVIHCATCIPFISSLDTSCGTRILYVSLALLLKPQEKLRVLTNGHIPHIFSSLPILCTSLCHASPSVSWFLWFPFLFRPLFASYIPFSLYAAPSGLAQQPKILLLSSSHTTLNLWIPVIAFPDMSTSLCPHFFDLHVSGTLELKTLFKKPWFLSA